MNAINAIAGIGHNAPPLDLREALEPAALAIMVASELAPHTAAADALLAEYQRFVVATEAGISTDAVDHKALDFRNDLDAALDALDATRTTIKAPVLAAQRAIDGAAKLIAEPVTAARAEVHKRHATFLLFKDEEIRRIAREEADRLEAAAWHATQEAAETGEVAKLDEARDARAGQRAAEGLAFGSVLETTRMKTAAGNTSGLRDHWTYEVTDLATVPPAYLQINERVLKAAIASGTRKLPGLRIFNDPKAR